MSNFRIEVEGADLAIDMLDSDDWRRLALEEAKEIRERTETRGLDVNNEVFKPYTKAYADYRAEKGRSTWPNLSFTGKMLGALGSNVSSTDTSATITLSGDEGNKAWSNERRGREFMGVTRERLDKIAEELGDMLLTRIK